MSFQGSLFHDSVLDALGTDVKALGGPKVVAGLLWPADARGPDRLRACLSENHEQKLKADEIYLIKKLAKEKGSTAAVDYEISGMGGEVKWIKPEDEAAALMRQYNESVKSQDRLVTRMEQVAKRLGK